ncbi:MAG: DUF58 domain-containing protein [Actinobacteria bacterium]|nr:DUF58 domain-containing protein [Actinomycetota bacterium]
MTIRGRVLLLVSVVAVGAGWRFNWPEIVALGTAGIAAVVAILLVLGTKPRGTLSVDQDSLRVVRLQSASVRVTLDSDRPRRAMRLVEGVDASNPTGSVRITRAQQASTSSLRFPLDTSQRGQRPMGPFALVQGDPWGIVQRTIDRAEGGIVTIQPRVFPVRRALMSQNIIGDADSAAKQRGDVHFHALRDYVLGDEARMVHWRSSARAGHLVVKQNLAPTAEGTTIVLDTDVSAYGDDHQFGKAWLPERFEAAIEVVASIVVSLPKGSGQVNVVTTASGSRPSSAASGAASSLLDRLAVVEASPPLEVVPAQLVSAVRSTRCSRLIVVTGTPSRTLPLAIVAATRVVGGTLVIRVGASKPAPLAGLRVLDVAGAEDLV